MKILFLDIDGVLNKFTWVNFEPELVANLDRLCREVPDLGIVVSSTWREDHSNEDLAAYLREAGSTVAEKLLVGQTPIHSNIMNRGNEIQEWLDKHPHVSKFAIVDDNDWMNHLSNHLFKTMADVGMDETVTNDLIGYFNA